MTFVPSISTVLCCACAVFVRFSLGFCSKVVTLRLRVENAAGLRAFEASRRAIMGANGSSQPAKVAGSVLRKAGEPLNTLGYQVVHEKVVYPTGTKPTRLTICRCWQSLRFPLCDNTHQRLQKLGVDVGPVMVEIKPGTANVCAEQAHQAPKPFLSNLGGPKAAVFGGVAGAAFAAGAAGMTGSFPM